MPKAVSLVAVACLAGALLVACGGTGGGVPRDGSADATTPKDSAAPQDSASATLPSGKCVAGAYPRDGVCACQPPAIDVCDHVCAAQQNDAGQCVSGLYNAMFPDSQPVPLGPACVDLQTDDDHCGECGTRCAPNATCVGGACGALPTTAVAKPDVCGPMRLAASAGTLFWTDTMNGKVMSMPAAGGAPSAVSGAETSAPTLLFVNGQTVFWLDGKTIRRSAGGAVSTVVTSADDIRGLASSDDGATVYFSSGSKIERVPAAGGPTADVVLQDSGGLPSGISVQGDLMAFLIDVIGGIDITQLGAVVAHCWTMDPNAPDQIDLDVNCRRLGYGAELNEGVVLTTPSSLFWADGPFLVMNELGAQAPVQRYPVVTTDAAIRSMALSNGEIFFVDFDGSMPGQVQKVAAAKDSTAIPLARNITGPMSVAVDGKRVFWVTSDCEIQTTSTGD